MLYETTSIIAGIFYNFTLVEMKGTNKLFKLKKILQM